METLKSGIYLITICDKYVYVGSAKNFEIRWEQHLHNLKAGTHCNIILQRLFNKHGIDNFSFEVIELVEYVKDEILRAASQALIQELGPLSLESNRQIRDLLVMITYKCPTTIPKGSRIK